ncbi:MAG: helix-turn-helix transcriptional regulator [Hormoscilla sp. GM7CHS1pb]|nr:helix-turn-helix transcriptional regulator [Hormoscilla sp. GM7CHS1pb]
MDMQALSERAELTRTELAYKLGVSETSVRNWERGRTKPTLTPQKYLEALNLFQCTPEELAAASEKSIGPDRQSSGKKPIQQDEWVAIIVAFLSIGTIFAWSLTRTSRGGIRWPDVSTDPRYLWGSANSASPSGGYRMFPFVRLALLGDTSPPETSSDQETACPGEHRRKPVKSGYCSGVGNVDE